MFSYAVKRKLRPDNPCRGVEKPPEVKRNRRLSEVEYAQLGAALNSDMISDIFLLLAVTGFRSSEAIKLRWSECDLERSIVTLGDTKTGVSVRPLSSAAIEIIKRQRQNGAPYVFADEHGKTVNSHNRHWQKLGMAKDVTPHVLRHSFASLAADLGHADSTIAGLIGHKQQSITSRYLHLDKTLVSAANTVASETLRLMRLSENYRLPHRCWSVSFGADLNGGGAGALSEPMMKQRCKTNGSSSNSCGSAQYRSQGFGNLPPGLLTV